MNETSDIKGGKRKRGARRQDDDESLTEPARKLTKKMLSADSRKRTRAASRPDNDESLMGPAKKLTEGMLTADNRKRTRAASRPDNDESRMEPASKLIKRMPSADVNPNSAADDYPAGQEVDMNGSSGQVGDEEAAGHASANKSSEGDPVKCPVCSATITTQEVGTPDTCDHTFCAACIQELSKNDNTCPVDGQMFNAILLRRHLEGDVISTIPVEPPRRQGQGDHQTALLRNMLRRLPYLAAYVLYCGGVWKFVDSNIS
jgi:hypothetical protein